MRLLITGACGFIGTNLCHHLLADEDYQLLAYDKLTYAANIEGLAELQRHENFSFVNGDITNPNDLKTVINKFKPHRIMNLAAESHVDRSILQSSEFIKTNIVGTHVLLGCALEYFEAGVLGRDESFLFHHVSTDEVYGSLGDTGAFSEETRYDPSSPYSASKAASDHLVRAWFKTYGLPCVITNCSNNYGPYQFPEKLIPKVISKMLKGRSIPVYGDGQNVRDWIYVSDHAAALETVVLKGTPGETYNIGGRTELTNLQLIRRLADMVGKKINRNASDLLGLIEFVPDRLGHDERYAIDDRKISTQLGWSPATDIQLGLEKTVDWYIKNLKTLDREQ